jgi:glycine betaine/proline transport system permease protein
MMNLLLGSAMLAIMLPLMLYRFTATKPVAWLIEFPADKTVFNSASSWLDSAFDAVAIHGSGFFDGITSGIRVLLDGLEVVLVDTPWPVITLVILFMAWRLAGPRVAIFTVAALAYLAFLGYWEKSMATIALLGAAATLCVVVGVPFGILCAKNRTVDSIARPVLDFMQTMPAFVYLIPIIAFFGTGKPPGILATLIFGMPPVVRLTALGIKQVPPSIVEGALAFGCSRRKLLLDVEIPLAMTSILAGINQTILMCLSMVVIASLIGAEGLGTDVLMALQFAAKGQGLLAGLAILFCAMIIDRIVQGCFKPTGRPAD